MPDLDRSALIENRINSGILGQWYPVAKSVEVKSISPLGIEVLGEKLVLWRGDKGKVHCIKDQCPHRGAPLSFGRLHEGHISCRYHGIVVSGEGVVVSVPAVQNCAFEGQKIVRAFEVQEIYDAIFIYMPSAENAKAPRLVFPKEFLSDSYVVNSVDKQAYLASLALANKIVVTCDSTSMISEAAASGKPIFVAHMQPKMNNYRFERFFHLFREMGITRNLEEKVENWSYKHFNEAERIAPMIHSKLSN